jgi:ubiquinone/menaquinone biosynthesis C-methylase UbiE
VNAHAAPFDGLAASYDRTFTSSAIGQRMRRAVWRRMDQAFRPGDRVLELNCGTGEDAVHLGSRGVRVHATDASPQMLAITRAKVERAGLTGMIDVAQMPIEKLAGQWRPSSFDGVLSNFGGLNCVDDLQAVAYGLAAIVRPGGRALLCLMGPAVPWEWAWYLAHGQPRKAMRRLGNGGSRWRGLTVHYPSISKLRRAFAPHFMQRRVSAVGALAPPTFAEPWAARHPRWLAALDRVERRSETVWPLPWLADHYLIELERVGVRADP